MIDYLNFSQPYFNSCKYLYAQIWKLSFRVSCETSGPFFKYQREDAQTLVQISKDTFEAEKYLYFVNVFVATVKSDSKRSLQRLDYFPQKNNHSFFALKILFPEATISNLLVLTILVSLQERVSLRLNFIIVSS